MMLPKNGQNRMTQPILWEDTLDIMDNPVIANPKVFYAVKPLAYR